MSPDMPAKKDSIFSSIAPAPAPMPAAAPAPRHAADPEALSALKLKIETLEKNLVAQLDKKLGDHLKTVSAPPQPAPQPAFQAPPPAPARQAESDALFRKIEDLERRLADFGHAATFSVSQLKNIEESKVSARREIEDLLKAVREQQKYSEMDRQMHEQLEKAWTRAEQLEKKLMDFYSSVITLETKRREEASAASDKSAAAINALADRLAGLEQKLTTFAEKPAEFKRAQEELLARAEAERNRTAAAQEAVSREVLASVSANAAALGRLADSLAGLEGKVAGLVAQPLDLKRAQEDFLALAAAEKREAAAARDAAAAEAQAAMKRQETAFREIFEGCVRRDFELMRGELAGETAALKREAAEAAQELRRQGREQAAAAELRTDEFVKVVQENRLKADGVAASLEVSAQRQARALEEFARGLGGELRGLNAEYAAAVKKESDERFEKFGAKYADALLAVTFIENFRASVGGALERIETSRAQLQDLLKDAPAERLEKALGVSGMLLRAKFEAMAAALEGLQADGAGLREIKRGVEERFRDVFGSR